MTGIDRKAQAQAGWHTRDRIHTPERERMMRNATSNVQVKALVSTATAADIDNRLKVEIAHVKVGLAISSYWLPR